jgi:hypothetical protein
MALFQTKKKSTKNRPPKPPPPAAKPAKAAQYSQRKERARRGQAEQSRSGRDIGQLPPIADIRRNKLCEHDFGRFSKTYLPEKFPLAWSDDHKIAIHRIEDAVLHGGLFSLAFPRSLSE